MTAVMFISSSISIGLEYWSVNHTSLCNKTELKVFENRKCLGETSNNRLSDLLGTNVCKTIESCL